MKKIIIILLLFVIAGSTKAQNNTKLFQQANDAYTASKYNNAIELYLEILSNGYESPNLYYNLGNSYFKINNIPQSIYYYEKSLKLKPNFDNADFNLKVANTKIVDKIDGVPLPFYMVWKISIENLFTLYGWSIIIIASLIVFLGLFIIYLMSNKIIIRKLSFWSSMFVFILFIFFNVCAYSQYLRIYDSKQAIVFDPSVNIKSSPDDKSTDIFVIHEGSKVSIIDKLGEWSEIKIANGSTGWVKTMSLKEI